MLHKDLRIREVREKNRTWFPKDVCVCSPAAATTTTIIIITIIEVGC